MLIPLITKFLLHQYLMLIFKITAHNKYSRQVLFQKARLVGMVNSKDLSWLIGKQKQVAQKASCEMLPLSSLLPIPFPPTEFPTDIPLTHNLMWNSPWCSKVSEVHFPANFWSKPLSMAPYLVIICVMVVFEVGSRHPWLLPEVSLWYPAYAQMIFPCCPYVHNIQ